jgi:hypothetical protein
MLSDPRNTFALTLLTVLLVFGFSGAAAWSGSGRPDGGSHALHDALANAENAR